MAVARISRVARVLILLLPLACGDSGSSAGTTEGGSDAGGETQTSAGATTLTTSETAGSATSATSSGSGSTGSGSTASTTAGTATTTTDPTATGTTGASTSDTTTATTAGTTTATTTTTTDTSGECGLPCNGVVLACGNCEDDDGDGLVDLADPECVSICDDDESTFQTGIPGDNMDCKQDCFFDGNSGAGDDNCEWNLRCDPEREGAADCAYNPNLQNCEVAAPDTCIAACEGSVPNGCDCFGCCTITVDGTSYDVYLGDPNCSLANIATCQTCTPQTDCGNPCEPEMCEVCIGQDPEDLPPECGEQPTCPVGETSCTVDPATGEDSCPSGQFCLTGCCVSPPG